MNNRRIIFDGARDSLPLIFPSMPFGIVFGAMAKSLGLSDVVTMAFSILVFAGSSQFIAITLLASGAALPVIIVTTFIVNLRHILYAFSLLPYVRSLSHRMRLAMGFLVTDETYATVINRISQAQLGNDFSRYYLGSGILMYSNWVFCTYLGIVAGNQFPQLTDFGLDIAMVVAFVGIVVANLRLPSHWICAAVAAVSGTLTYAWPNQTGLLFSSCMAIAAGVIAENIYSARNNNQTPKAGETS
ncbi:AzlC family ABC transporter permease [Alteromonadaceae bacterium BrNp21-10]|nr:AzlC family ABC transporter permease [Alteromonadaceae bacterium BrNp21-10]